MLHQDETMLLVVGCVPHHAWFTSRILSFLDHDLNVRFDQFKHAMKQLISVVSVSSLLDVTCINTLVVLPRARPTNAVDPAQPQQSHIQATPRDSQNAKPSHSNCALRAAS